MLNVLKHASSKFLGKPHLQLARGTFPQRVIFRFRGAQKHLPERQLCELVDRYYGGWKQTQAYGKLKGYIRSVLFVPNTLL